VKAIIVVSDDDSDSDRNSDSEYEVTLERLNSSKNDCEYEVTEYISEDDKRI
jgi:hypothetical protein